MPKFSVIISPHSSGSAENRQKVSPKAIFLEEVNYGMQEEGESGSVYLFL